MRTVGRGNIARGDVLIGLCERRQEHALTMDITDSFIEIDVFQIWMKNLQGDVTSSSRKDIMGVGRLPLEQ
jgi:hypothetical protein